MSVGELEITRRMSPVAVWFSSDSVSSRVRVCTSSNSRAFSMAITAWSAKVSTSSICFGRERPQRLPTNCHDAQGGALAQQRHGEHRAIIAEG